MNIDETGGRDIARVYDLTKAHLKFSLPTTERKISCVSIASATRRVLTGSSVNCLSIWDLDTGAVVGHFSGCNYPIHGFTLSRDCTRVLTSSLVTGKQSMRVYDLVNGRFLAAFTPEESWRNAFHANNVVICKPGFTGIVKFRLLSLNDGEAEVTERGKKIDWGEIRVSMDDSTGYLDDGDDDNQD